MAAGARRPGVSQRAARDYLLQVLPATPRWARCSARPEIEGRFFYNEDLSGFNFRPAKIKLDTVLDEIAAPRGRGAAAGASTWARPPSTPACPDFRDENDLDFGDARPAGQHLDRQSHAHRRASRPAGQPGLRGRRVIAASRCFRPSSWRTCTSVRWISRPRARPSAWSISRKPDFAAIPALRRGAASMRRWPSSGPAMRSSSPACGGTTSKSLDTLNVLVNYWWRAVARRTWTRRSAR